MVHVGLSVNDKINLIQSKNMQFPYWRLGSCLIFFLIKEIPNSARSQIPDLWPMKSVDSRKAESARRQNF